MASGDETTEARVLRAAYACFERRGIAKATIEDIAGEAGVSRPTVYKYFPSGKDGLLDELARREVVRINAEVRRQIVRGPEFAEYLTDVLVIVVRTAARSVYVRRTIEHHPFQVAALRESSAMFQLQREWWGPLLRHAAERGELAGDLAIDEAILWLSRAQAMLLQSVEDPTLDDAQLRRMIRRFVVAPLLAS